MDSLFNAPVLQFSMIEIASHLGLSVALGFFAALLYSHTHRGTSYSQSFVKSLVLITVIAAIIIMVIGNSLVRAFGLIGAFTVIRFRTAVKDARDMAFLFLCLVLGLAAGVGAYQIAISGFFVVSLVIFGLDRMQFGRKTTGDYLVQFVFKRQHIPAVYQHVFREYLQDHRLLNVHVRNEKKETHVSFSVSLKRGRTLADFTTALTQIRSIAGIEVMSTRDDSML